MLAQPRLEICQSREEGQGGAVACGPLTAVALVRVLSQVRELDVNERHAHLSTAASIRCAAQL